MRSKLVIIGLALLFGATSTAQASIPFSLANAPSGLLPAAALTFGEKNPESRPFQARVIVSPQSTGFFTQFLQIPLGKRLIIENISAIARCPEGLRMEINFFCHIDNNNDGVGDVADITFHRIALTDQGVFDGVAIASANHKVLVFADEQIGTAHFQVGVSARLTGTAPAGVAQAQVTFTGYVEDLPTSF